MHVILDNEMHESTGGQATTSTTVDFARVGAAANYRNVFNADCADGIDAAISEIFLRPGPSLLHIKIRPGSPAKLGRPTVTPQEIQKRFSDFLSAQRAQSAT